MVITVHVYLAFQNPTGTNVKALVVVKKASVCGRKPVSHNYKTSPYCSK
jgi:hypothetical protein